MNSHHLQMANVKVQSIFPKRRQDLVKENGWGYSDSYIYFDKTKSALMFHGKRYPGVGSRPLGRALTDFKELFAIDISKHDEAIRKPSAEDYTLVDNEKFRAGLRKLSIEHSIDFQDRFYRGHSQSSYDIYVSLFGKFVRIPDIVAWPRSHEQVCVLVQLANECDVALVPFGGGSNVTGSTQCPARETRSICSLDTTQMCRMLWLDTHSRIAAFEAGVCGQDLERVLGERGFTAGHSPDSLEFSTLGGWIATKSSGMRQQRYGNIEDIVVSFKLVTPTGVLEQKALTPRMSEGPDLERLVIGSEGTLGVITEAIVKIHEVPPCTKYAAIVFPDIRHGIAFLHECSTRSDQILPANLRLFCNTSVRVGMTMEETGGLSEVKHAMKKFFLRNFLRLDENAFVSASYMLEGDEASVKRRDTELRAIYKKFGGFRLSKKPAIQLYTTSSIYSIYMRDFFFTMGIIGDTVETSVMWSNLESCIETILTRYKRELKRLNLSGSLFYRLSQVYHEGVCLYTYYFINKCENHLEQFVKVTDFIKNVITEAGGSLSHHHGIGAKNTQRYDAKISKIKKQVLRKLKATVDPKNIFCAQNFFVEEEKSEIVAKL